jgi:hypothetical protein
MLVLRWCCGLFVVVVMVAGRRWCVGLIEGGAVSHACCCRSGHTPIHWAAGNGRLSSWPDGNGHLSCLELLIARDVLMMSVTMLPLVVSMLLMASILYI